MTTNHTGITMTRTADTLLQQERTMVIADDHAFVRHGLKELAEKEGYSIVAECNNADSIVELTRKHNPAFIVMDLALPGKSGLEAIKEISKMNGAAPKIVVLSGIEDEATIRHAFAVGASGYVLKQSEPEDLFDAFQKVEQGDQALPSRLAHLAEEISNDSKTRKNGKVPTEIDPLGKLSKREREVFYLLADGLPNRVIAKQLYISPRTVETHRARVIKKLGFQSTADLIRYAIRNKLLT